MGYALINQVSLECSLFVTNPWNKWTQI